MDQINNIKKTVSAFCALQQTKEQDARKDVLESRDKVLLEVTFKKVPLNHEPYVDVIGPLAAPINSWSDLSICFFVRDINKSRKRHRDRELDLNQSRQHYKDLLLEAGLPESLLRNLCIMPVRELLTEYKTFQTRSRLAATFDVFLVDASLYNNKFKFLRSFLGNSFADHNKKCLIPVYLKDSERIKANFLLAVRSTTMYISGHGQSCSVVVGRSSFDQLTLARNLKKIVTHLQRKYDNLVCTLRLCDESLHGITFFADLRTVDSKSYAQLFPLTKLRRVKTPVAAQYTQPGPDELSDVELETEGGKFELKPKKVRYEDISIF